jgi:hypothetical protein
MGQLCILRTEIWQSLDSSWLRTYNTVSSDLQLANAHCVKLDPFTGLWGCSLSWVGLRIKLPSILLLSTNSEPIKSYLFYYQRMTD